ncbi:putative integral membrane protein [Cryptosporidium felis]|nr:putative integral membrane protein [Cryptosporidium felis]
MRHQRRLPCSKKGEREQFKHPLLPYPEKVPRVANKKSENYPEFLFCIPIKPASSILGLELDIFVRITTIVSICVWLNLLILEGLYFYTVGLGTQAVFFVAFAVLLGVLVTAFGIFCGIIGYIGCTISNPRCIYFFFMHLNFQLIVNIYAVITSIIRGYLIYSLIYSLCIILSCLFLFPSWSLYTHIKLNGNPPNVSKYYGLLNEILCKYELLNESKSNHLDDSESFTDNVCSSLSNGPGVNTSAYIKNTVFQKKDQKFLTKLKQKRKDNSSERLDNIIEFSNENDNVSAYSKLSCDRTAYMQPSDSTELSSNSNCCSKSNQPSAPAGFPIEGQVLFNYPKPFNSASMNFVALSTADYSNRNSGITPSYEIQTAQQNLSEFPRTDVYKGL